jgi:branched-chain amino acid transport system substrate-binding protein
MKNAITVTLAALGAAIAANVHAQEQTVGIPMALTGPYAFVGVPVRNGVVLGLEEMAAQHGLKLKTIVEDDASEKGQAITLANRMAARDRVLIMVGPTSSIEGTAAAPVANDQKMPMLTSAVSEDVTKAGPWSFKATASPSVIMRALAEYTLAKLKPKSAIMVYARDNDGFIAQKNAVRDGLKAGGVNILSEESVASADSDFTALATKLVAAKPDVVYLSIGAEAGASLIIQAKQAGLPETTRFIAPPGFASTQLIKVGGKAVEGVIFVADYFNGNPSPLNQKFAEAYEKKYGGKPDNWAAVGYTMGIIAGTAIKDAGPNPTREGVRNALAAMKDVPTVLGKGKWNLDANRNPYYGAAVLMVKDGAFTLAP